MDLFHRNQKKWTLNRYLRTVGFLCGLGGICGCGGETESSSARQSEPIPEDAVLVQIRYADYSSGMQSCLSYEYQKMIDHTQGATGISEGRVTGVFCTLQEKTPEGYLTTFDYRVDGEQFLKKDVLVTGKPQVIDYGSGWEIFVGTRDGISEGKL